jgi:hypothetical protein
MLNEDLFLPAKKGTLPGTSNKDQAFGFHLENHELVLVENHKN